MTTANSSFKEAMDLFQQALAKTTQVIREADQIEDEVVIMSRELLLAAFRTVVPALKLVDCPISAESSWVRGVALSTVWGGELVLTRDGKIIWCGEECSPESFTPLTNLWDNPEAIALSAIDALQKLGEVYTEAIKRNEGRRAKMIEISNKLNRASAVFTPKA